MFNKQIIIILIMVIFSFSNLISEEMEADSNSVNIDFQGQKFVFMLKAIQKYYPDSVDIEELCTKTFKYMAKEIDKYSAYYSKNERTRKKAKDKGEAIGIGVNLLPLSDTVTVIYVIEGSPADSVGILPGDKIISIDQKTSKGLNQQEALDMMKGDLGSVVEIEIHRGYEPETRLFKIKRKRYPLSSVSASFIIPGTDIAYINFNRFSKASDTEFREEIEKFKKRGFKKIILDLRSNLGGYLSVATKMIDEFLPPDKMISYTKARSDVFNFEYKSTENHSCLDIPLIILINSRSASATEAMAGAVQDFDRGIVVGERSYGKGSAQKIWDMKDGSAFKMTIAKYMTPSGRCIEKETSTSEIDNPIGDDNKRKRISDVMAAFGGKSKLPVFKTEKGRTVFGGGGIIPDYIVPKDSTTKLSSVLISKGIIFEFVYSLLYTNRDAIISQYENSIDKFVLNFKINDNVLTALKRFSVSKNIWNEDMFEYDKEYIRHIIKATIAEAIWKKNGYKAVMINYDNYVAKAIEVMPKAEKMKN